MPDADELPLPLRRYVPLLVALLVTGALLFIPMQIIGLGFMPPDDALRHVAKVLSGKTWAEIMVLRPGITIDHNAGWHAILGAVQQATDWQAADLLTFSMVGLALVFLLLPLATARRIEAWPLALLAVVICFPHFPYRFMLGRPYILMVAAFMWILAAWHNADYRPGPRLLALTTVLIGIAAWVHGGWYQYGLPAGGLLLARRWRAGGLMLGCWLAGSVLGGLITGHPVHFLTQQFMVLVSCFGHHSLQRMLVTEFLPHDGQYTVIALLAGVALVRHLAGRPAAGLLRDPLLLLAAFTWMLGFKVQRFWLDWGLPASLVWLTIEFRFLLDRMVNRETLGRLAITGLACGALALGASSDLAGRWTWNLTREYLTPETPEIEGWLPDAGGIVYSDAMPVFYETFFHNPTAPWRYMLGFESTFMPDEDRETFRKIQWNYGTWEAYRPWVKKMGPADRLIVRRGSGNKPDLQELEWRYAASDTWIGRTPRRSQNAP